MLNTFIAHQINYLYYKQIHIIANIKTKNSTQMFLQRVFNKITLNFNITNQIRKQETHINLKLVQSQIRGSLFEGLQTGCGKHYALNKYKKKLPNLHAAQTIANPALKYKNQKNIV